MPQEPQNIRSEVVQDILERLPSWPILWGNTLLLVMLVLVFGISWFVKYPDVLAADALISTTIPPQKEYAATTGKLTEVFIENGAAVIPGQPLAVIENTADHQDVLWLKKLIDTITVSKTHFDFPIDQVPVLFLGEIEPGYAAFENAYLAYVLNDTFQPHAANVNENSQVLEEMNGRLTLLLKQYEIANEELVLKTKDFQRHELLFENGAIAEQAFEQNKLALLRNKSSVEGLALSISQLRQEIKRTKVDSRRLQQDMTRSEINLLKNTVQAFNQLKNSVLDWELKYLIRSKIAGEACYYNYWEKENTVKAGDLLFTIIPEKSDAFVARLKLPMANVGKVSVGQQVLIELSSYPKAEYGVLSGTVITTPIISGDQETYLLDVSLPETLITSHNHPIEFRHEITGAAEIITHDLRLLERFFNRLNDF